jgi:hypothetical protein
LACDAEFSYLPQTEQLSLVDFAISVAGKFDLPFHKFQLLLFTNSGGFMTFRSLRASASFAALSLLATFASPAFSLPTHNVSTGLAMASDQGRVDPNKEMNLTVVLKLHNRAAFDKAVEDLYDPASPTFRQWFTDKDFEKYAPTAEEFARVKNELIKQGFKVVDSDPARFSMRVHGTAAVVEKAFQTELHTFTYSGKTFQAHVRDAQLAGPAGELIDSVAGIERHVSTPQLSTIHNPNTGLPVIQKPLATKAEQNSFVSSLTDAPLTVAASETFTGGGVTAKFGGLQYGASGLSAAFTPAQLRTHYGLDSLTKLGYDGAGQTIALVEGYGYPTAEADANLAASIFGLPALTSANFSVVYPEGRAARTQYRRNSGPAGMSRLPWTSSRLALPSLPRAKILVVAAAGQDDEDQLDSLSYIITHKLASTVSSSWEKRLGDREPAPLAGASLQHRSRNRRRGRHLLSVLLRRRRRPEGLGTPDRRGRRAFQLPLCHRGGRHQRAQRPLRRGPDRHRLGRQHRVSG